MSVNIPSVNVKKVDQTEDQISFRRFNFETLSVAFQRQVFVLHLLILNEGVNKKL